ncbi:deaminase, partial [Vibrio vulnificus]
MNSTQYFVAASLDGFIATADDDLAWLFEFNGADGQEAAYQRFYDGVGALMMGADTFRF